MSMEESISLEETNKIRISLGLKPLTDDAAPTDDKEKQAEDNYARQREQEAKARESKQIQDRIAKVRNRRELRTSLQGATLGDADGETDDTIKWIKRSKKKEKELAKKRQEELENMDKAFQGEQYTERDLVGLKVSHDFEEMDEGEARILTLKDSRILDNEEDELQNVEMAEEERRRKNQELKSKKRDYKGYDDDEFVPGSEGMKRAVLAKYDEDIEGTTENGFRLGSSTIPKDKPRAQKEQEAASVNKSLLSIDYAKNLETADYMQEGDVGFKKPKTKKKRSNRRVPEFSDMALTADAMEVDEKPIVPRTRNLNTNFVDDDELQAALARSRQAKLHKPKKLSPEDVAKQIAEERTRAEEAAVIAGRNPVKEDDEEGGELVFDDTSEFFRALSHKSAVVKTEPPEPPIPRAESKRSPSPSPKDEMDVDEELEAGELVMEDEEDEDEMAVLNAIENAIKMTEAEEAIGAGDVNVGTSAEQTFGAGMASTLNILRQQGILATPAADQRERERTQLQRDLWLADHRARVAQRELERLTARGANKDQATREYENRQREQQEARGSLEAFKNYKPDVNIVYYDEFGRTLTAKEAWKALSHKFHGKGSGKMKTEKRLKKISEEKKKEAMASGDTPLSMSKAFQMRQEKTKQAHFVLSVGNRGAVPQAAEFLDAQPLSKGKTERLKNKKKDAAIARTQMADPGFMTLPAPHTISNGGSAALSALSTPNSGSPGPSSGQTMKPGFSRISSAIDSPATSRGETPMPGDRTKVAFGFAAKRKATDDAPGSPSPKRR